VHLGSRNDLNDLWQIHFALLGTQTDDSFTMINARNGFSKTYKAGS
jgi:hypothetical protein